MKRDFSLLCGRQFDLLVCGGGIYGAWTAYDAALRGLSVAIVEQGDWAGATSSASSKLIHGGLRYLETYDFRLVKKALRERQMLLEAAPHRVWPLRFGVPVYADSRIGTVQLMAGLTLYDFFAGGLNTKMSHRHFDAQAFAERFPFLAPANLQGGFTYADAQTDDARLVLELIDGAMAAGAVCVNYCKLTGFLETDSKACGATVQDQLDGVNAEIFAKQIVNATGQWTTATQEGNGWCRLTKGIHLLLPAALGEEALLLTAKSDGRVFFMIPWYGLTLIGTTDTDYQGDINHVAVETTDVAYLLAEANHYLKTAWTEADIIGSYAGVRVMKHDDKSSPSSTSRDWELKTALNGVLYSVGGKITSAREDAAHIVNAVCAQLGVNTPCPTKGKKFPWAPDEDYSAWLLVASSQAMQLSIDEASTKWLIRRHGKRVKEVFSIIKNNPQMAERIMPALPFIYADLLWSARNEMVVHMDDLLRRRMPLLILARLSENDLQRIAASVAATLGWDEAALNQEIETCRQPWLSQ
jgi:glycerol-3-phosphate dehydrogenase